MRWKVARRQAPFVPSTKPPKLLIPGSAEARLRKDRCCRLRFNDARTRVSQNRAPHVNHSGFVPCCERSRASLQKEKGSSGKCDSFINENFSQHVIVPTGTMNLSGLN
jgi:hypothetical protein